MMIYHTPCRTYQAALIFELPEGATRRHNTQPMPGSITLKHYYF